LIAISEFDTDGHLIKRTEADGTVYTYYIPSGRMHTKTMPDGTIYEYDDTNVHDNGTPDPDDDYGHLIKETRPNGTYKIFSDYYDADHARFITDYTSQHFPMSTIYEYSDPASGYHLIKETRPDGIYKLFTDYFAGTNQWRYVSEYTLNGILLVRYEYNINGKYIGKTVYSSPEDFAWSEPGQTDPRFSFTYNSKGRIETKRISSSAIPCMVVTYYFLNESFDFNGDGYGEGYGRISKSEHNGANQYGERSFKYSYYAGTARISTVKAYRFAGWTNLLATYTYYNDTYNRIASRATTEYLEDNTAIKVTYNYYNNALNVWETKVLSIPDASGNIYYHYILEDWNSQGHGRIDRSKRKTALNGELTYSYTYYDDADGKLREKKAYLDANWTILVATYTYYNDYYNSVESKTLVDPDAAGNIYYHYGNEIYNRGLVDKTKRLTPLNGEMSHTYDYSYTLSTYLLSHKQAYSDDNWTNLYATYWYYTVDKDNRLKSKTLVSADSDGLIHYEYFNEDWNGQGYGRVSKTRRASSVNDELSYEYSYHEGTDHLSMKKAYRLDWWQGPVVATYTYSETYLRDADGTYKAQIMRRYDSAGTQQEGILYYVRPSDKKVVEKKRVVWQNGDYPSAPAGYYTYWYLYNSTWPGYQAGDYIVKLRPDGKYVLCTASGAPLQYYDELPAGAPTLDQTDLLAPLDPPGSSGLLKTEGGSMQTLGGEEPKASKSTPDEESVAKTAQSSTAQTELDQRLDVQSKLTQGDYLGYTFTPKMVTQEKVPEELKQ
ncbi:MAG: hypothetical protein PHP46_04065, partial [Candidatus Omnitrophica bacterium]|nr:hypothetical protein [Candidatus Omnitrophota bacterium]